SIALCAERRAVRARAGRHAGDRACRRDRAAAASGAAPARTGAGAAAVCRRDHRPPLYRHLHQYAGAVILPSLIARLRNDAPKAEIRILPSNTGVAESLRAGRADLAIGSYRRVPEWAQAETLMQETRVWVVSADHPAAQEELTLERLAELPQLVISATGEDERAIDGYVVDHGLERMVTRSDAGIVQGAFALRGLRRTVAVTTPHFLGAIAVISQS